MTSTRRVATAGGVLVAALLTYRAVRLYLRNDITITITELVRLTPAKGAGQDRRRPSRAADAAATVTIKGKVEVEVCVIRSYRLLLRLLGNVCNSESAGGLGGGLGGGGGGSGAAGPGVVARQRVLPSLAARAASDDLGEGSLSSRTLLGGDGSGRRGQRSGSQQYQPTVLVTNANAMVDVCEIDMSGQVCFTPTCIMEDTLLTYIAAPAPALLMPGTTAEDDGDGRSILAAALTGGPDGAGNVAVRGCYLQADPSSPNAQRLSLELEVSNPVHGLQLLIRLPHRRCRVLHTDTHGVGSLRQPLRRRPHRLVWEVGTVTAADGAGRREGVDGRTHKTRRSARRSGDEVGESYSPAGDDAGASNSALAWETRVRVLASEEENELGDGKGKYPGHAAVSDDGGTSRELREAILCDPSLAARLLIARCTVVYEHIDDRFDEEETSSDGGAGGVDDPSMGASTDYDEGGEGDDKDDVLFAAVGSGEGRRRRAMVTVRGSGGHGSPTAPRLRPVGEPNHSTKAARREARQQRRREDRQRRRQGAVLAGEGASVRLPTVEVTYSVNGLASGTRVKKLQVLSDRANWVPRSLFDRYILSKLLWGLSDRKLQRFANYTTWFVQSVPVTSL